MLSLAVQLARQYSAGRQSLHSEMGEGFFSAQTPPTPTGSAVIVEVRDRARTRWLLVEREDATGGRLDFPGVTKDGALTSAIRSVTEECCLVVEGLPVSWNGLEFQAFQGEAAPGLTVYHAVLKVPDVEALEAQALTTAYARRAQLLGILAIQSLVEEGRLTESAADLWRAYWAVQPECC